MSRNGPIIFFFAGMDHFSDVKSGRSIPRWFTGLAVIRQLLCPGLEGLSVWVRFDACFFFQAKKKRATMEA